MDNIVKLAAQLSAEPEAISEDMVALEFAARYTNELRFDHDRGIWFHWNGNIWECERTKLAFSWARSLTREMSKGRKSKARASVCRVNFASGVEKMAQADRAFAVTSDAWDRDHYLLGTPRGTVDLRTGELREARPEDLISKQTAVAPAATADCPLWLKFLREATQDNQGLIDFLQCFCGYCLTGDTKEHAFLFCWGPGGNGKGVTQNTVGAIMGDYRANAAVATFVATRGERHPTDLAMLHGARLVTSSETEEGHAWAESRIKTITGGDMVTARFMRQDFFQFKPQFKLLIIGNHKPTLQNVDEAARRRINMVSFLYAPATPDRDLEKKLEAEWPGILRWLIEGCLRWQREGLVKPSVVTEATNEYFEDQDSVQQWIDECCDTTDRRAESKNSDLFKSWSMWADVRGERASTSRWPVHTLDRMGFRKFRTKQVRGFRGIRVAAAPGVDTGDVELGAPPSFADYRSK